MKNTTSLITNTDFSQVEITRADGSKFTRRLDPMKRSDLAVLIALETKDAELTGNAQFVRLAGFGSFAERFGALAR